MSALDNCVGDSTSELTCLMIFEFCLYLFSSCVPWVSRFLLSRDGFCLALSKERSKVIESFTFFHLRESVIHISEYSGKFLKGFVPY